MYWRTTTQLCFGHRPPAPEAQPNVFLHNQIILDRLCNGTQAARGSLALPRVIDGWNWTSGRCRDFDDSIHHSRLGFEHVKAFLQDVCHMGASSVQRNLTA